MSCLLNLRIIGGITYPHFISEQWKTQIRAQIRQLIIGRPEFETILILKPLLLASVLITLLSDPGMLELEVMIISDDLTLLFLC